MLGLRLEGLWLAVVRIWVICVRVRLVRVRLVRVRLGLWLVRVRLRLGSGGSKNKVGGLLDCDGVNWPVLQWSRELKSKMSL